MSAQRFDRTPPYTAAVFACALATLASLACSSPSTADGSSETNAQGDAAPSRADEVPGTRADAASSGAYEVPVNWKAVEARCSAPAGVSASPANIEDAVILINALKSQQEGELSLPCFLQSLARPLAALATKSVFSAQPAAGVNNPRFFVFSDALVMSVVPAGEGRPLLELAAYTSDTRSIKAEIHFPVTETLQPTAPYERVRIDASTVCGGCHSNEVQNNDLLGFTRFESDVLRPRKSEILNIDYVRNQSNICPPEETPERCAILSALFDHGELTEGAFSPNARTIYGN